MATRWAVATGNWSNPAIWNGGTLPTSSDDVHANAFTVTIDQNITALSLRNTSTTGVNLGGGFVVSGAYSIELTAAAGGLIPGNTSGAVLTVSPPAGTAVSVSVVIIPGHNNPSGQSLTFSGAGVLNFTGNIASIQNGGNAGNITIGSTGTVNITGNIVYSSNGAAAIYINSTGTVNITGTVTSWVRIESSVVLTVTGNITGSNIVDCIAVSPNNVSPVITLNGTLTAGTKQAYFANPALNSGTLILTGPFVCSSTGVFPFYTRQPNVKIVPITNNYISFRDTSLNESRLYSGDTLGSPPSASNVRFGTTYAYGSLTGTLRMPTAQQVAFGVPVDATTGTAYFTVADFWNYLLSNGFTAGSIGDRLKNVATVDTTGSQLAAGN